MNFNRAEQVIPFVKGPRVLDIGCADHVPAPGSPLWLHGQLRKHFPEVCGIDLDAGNIKRLQDYGFNNLFVGNAESFSFDKKFDTVVAGELIEHVSNPALFLECAKKHVNPGGRIVITTPYPFSLLNMLYAFLKYPRTCQNPQHTCWFCPRTFTEMASRAGLEVMQWTLVQDYRLEDDSLSYRTFVRLMKIFGWVLPERLRCNAMLFVLTSNS